MTPKRNHPKVFLLGTLESFQNKYIENVILARMYQNREGAGIINAPEQILAVIAVDEGRKYENLGVYPWIRIRTMHDGHAEVGIPVYLSMTGVSLVTGPKNLIPIASCIKHR